MTNLENVRDALIAINSFNVQWAYGLDENIEKIKSICEKALSELEAYMENDGWLPIETAPKDGTDVLKNAGWHYHGCGLYSFEGCEAMSLRDALLLHKATTKTNRKERG